MMMFGRAGAATVDRVESDRKKTRHTARKRWCICTKTLGEEGFCGMKTGGRIGDSLAVPAGSDRVLKRGSTLWQSRETSADRWISARSRHPESPRERVPPLFKTRSQHEFHSFHPNIAAFRDFCGSCSLIGVNCRREVIVRSNQELVQAVVRHGDTESFSVLVRRYERLVWTIAWSYLRDYHSTQDVVQETFLTAHRQLKKLRDPDSIDSWLSQIARRQAQRFAETKKRDFTCDDLEIVTHKLVDGIPESQQELLDAVARLPEHERTAIVLRYLDGHSTSEVASLVGRSVGTVTKQISRAIKRLQERLATSKPIDGNTLDHSR